MWHRGESPAFPFRPLPTSQILAQKLPTIGSPPGLRSISSQGLCGLDSNPSYHFSTFLDCSPKCVLLKDKALNLCHLQGIVRTRASNTCMINSTCQSKPTTLTHRVADLEGVRIPFLLGLPLALFSLCLPLDVTPELPNSL